MGAGTPRTRCVASCAVDFFFYRVKRIALTNGNGGVCLFGRGAGRCGRDSPCEQLCYELHDGMFECDCEQGFTLRTNGYGCSSKCRAPASASAFATAPAPALEPASFLRCLPPRTRSAARIYFYSYRATPSPTPTSYWRLLPS